jgi:hypothetical protein
MRAVITSVNTRKNKKGLIISEKVVIEWAGDAGFGQLIAEKKNEKYEFDTEAMGFGHVVKVLQALGDQVETHENMNTDDLFRRLPAFIQVAGSPEYHFNLIKGRNRILVWYQQNKIDGGKYLCAHRGGETLNEALNQMHEWLVRFKYLKA